MRCLSLAIFVIAGCLGATASSAVAHGDEGPLPNHGRLPGQPDLKRIGKTTYRFLPGKEEYEIHREGRQAAFAHVDFAASEGVYAGPNTPLPEKEDAPICRSSGHRIVVVYTHRPSDPTATPTATLRNIVNRMNWKIVQQSSLSSGAARSVQMAVDCSGGEVNVYNVATANNNLSTVSSAVKAALFGEPQGTNSVKYLVFDHEANEAATGIAETQTDASKSFSNWNAKYTAVAVAYNGIWTTHVPMHEMFHTLGASQGLVSEPAPFSTSGSHCIDGLDILCYNDGSLRSSGYSETHCPASEGYDQPEKTPIDCDKDTYFSAAPEQGTWLATHWNTGGQEDPFLVNESDPLLVAGGGYVARLSEGEASLRGTVYAGSGLETTFRFEYGTTSSYGSSTSTNAVAAGLSGNEVEATATGLAPAGTTYHYRLVASNSKSSVYGQDHTLTTPLWLLTATPTSVDQRMLEDVSCTARNACTAVGVSGGQALAEHWDGGEWAQQSTAALSSVASSLDGVSCTGASFCMAVGSAYEGSPEAVYEPLAERWNGSAWSRVPVPRPSEAWGPVKLHGVSCSSSSSCVAVGQYEVVVQVEEETGEPEVLETRALIAKWDGSEWTLMSSPKPEGVSAYTLRDVSCISSEMCVAVGDIGVGAFGFEKLSGLIEGWNGKAWSVQATPAPGGGNSLLNDVSCGSGSMCVTAGERGSLPISERWNGSSWTESAPGNEAGQLTSVSCLSSGVCTVIGNGGGGGMTASTWSGSTWTSEPMSRPEGSSILGVSCTATSTCTAVGYRPNGEHYGDLAERRNPYVAPAASTDAATAVNFAEATLKGTVNPGGYATQYQFEYGTTTGYGSKAPASANGIGSGVNDAHPSETITGLKSGTTYHYRVVAFGPAGKSTGEDRTFTTTVRPPTVETEAPLKVVRLGAYMRGTVNPNGFATTFNIEYGTTTSYGSIAPGPGWLIAHELGSGTSDIPITEWVGGLKSDTTYHYRIAATNVGGTSYGEDMEFTTSATAFEGMLHLTSPYLGAIDCAMYGLIELNEGALDEGTLTELGFRACDSGTFYLQNCRLEVAYEGGEVSADSEASTVSIDGLHLTMTYRGPTCYADNLHWHLTGSVGGEFYEGEEESELVVDGSSLLYEDWQMFGSSMSMSGTLYIEGPLTLVP